LEHTIFWVAATIAVLLVGAGVFYALWQLGTTIKQVRQSMLPQVELTLVEVQRNLNRVDELAKDVDVTVEEANKLVASANNAVEAVGDGIQNFNDHVAVPLIVNTASALEGVKAGIRHWRERQQQKKQRALVVISEPQGLETPGIEAANI
jgi:uncharacterized protein YoxC